MKMFASEIKKDTGYWLVRPGINAKCYEDFYRDSCVAIGWVRIGKIDVENHLMSLDELK